jgi:hypothetical protein
MEEFLFGKSRYSEVFIAGKKGICFADQSDQIYDSSVSNTA